jgi:hypothetical protein
MPTSSEGGSRRFCPGSAHREVFPPEPPVAIMVQPEERGAVKGEPAFGAAKRTLDSEHGSGTQHSPDGRRSGNTFLLVGSERGGKNGDCKGERNRRCRSPLPFWTAEPMTARELTRRLITLIFAGRNRMVMIRWELPRTEYAGWVREPFRTERRGILLFVPLCAAIGSAVRCNIKTSLTRPRRVAVGFRRQPRSPT